MWFRHVSLLHGYFPAIVTAAAFCCAAMSVRRPTFRHLATWLMVGVVSLLSIAGLGWVFDVTATFGSLPPKFYLWFAVPLAVLIVSTINWRQYQLWRRLLVCAAVPLLICWAALEINSFYGYIPDLGTLAGGKLPGQVALTQVLSPTRQAVSAPPGAVRYVLPPGRSLSVGAVTRVHIPAPVSQFKTRTGWLWLPPMYFASPRPQLPVIVLLAGSPGQPSDWIYGGHALDVANAWAKSHHGWGPILVFPDNNGGFTKDTECVDGPRGRAETYLSVDVPNFVIANLGAATSPRRWAVAGLSEGGTCALDLALRHPARFGNFADFSGDAAPGVGSSAHTLQTLYTSQHAMQAHDPLALFPAVRRTGLRCYFATGGADHAHLRAQRALVDAATDAGLPVVSRVIPGQGHNFYTWSQALTGAFPWLVSQVAAGPSISPSDPALALLTRQ